MYTEIDLNEFDNLKQNGAFVVDVRESEELAGGVIDGMTHWPLSEFDKYKSSCPLDQEIIFYCRSGKRSIVACEQAQQWTEKQLYSLKGGYLGYCDRT